jgi:hypothetical protein
MPKYLYLTALLILSLASASLVFVSKVNSVDLSHKGAVAGIEISNPHLFADLKQVKKTSDIQVYCDQSGDYYHIIAVFKRPDKLDDLNGKLETNNGRAYYMWLTKSEAISVIRYYNSERDLNAQVNATSLLNKCDQI